ncbi:MAG: hypothetical protein FJW61_01760 [Actinobacteria bacterium]|nr:hypothetical protein [Actinomycetota bacterium]MBM3713659.1 hypothetical protein [Actinomycetota bacterium]
MGNVIIKKGTRCQYFVSGMHCYACEIVIEKKLSSYSSIKNIDVVLNKRKIYFEVEDDIAVEELLGNINNIIQAYGYSASEKASRHRIKWLDMLKGFIAAGIVVTAFILLQKFGISGILKVEDLNIPVSFLIGVIASLSSCMAVAGGLVLSISSSYARTNEKVKPLLLFHSARIVAFFILGGLLGIVGSAFAINHIAYFIISIILFIAMMVIGLNLLDISPFLNKLQLWMPKAFSRKLLINEGFQNRFTPVLLGIITFFLPCGFTQSMQLSSMTTRNFLDGGLLMLVFALGTLPMLGIISFTSIRFSRSSFSRVFFKAAGFIVIFFAIFNFISSLVSIGLIKPFLNL